MFDTCFSHLWQMGLRRRDREGGRRDWATDRTAADSGRLPGREAGLVRPTKLTFKAGTSNTCVEEMQKNRFAKLFAVIAQG